MAVQLKSLLNQNLTNLASTGAAGVAPSLPYATPLSGSSTTSTGPGADVGAVANPAVDGIQASSVATVASATANAKAGASSSVPFLPMQSNAAPAGTARMALDNIGGFSTIAAFKLMMDASSKSQNSQTAANRGLNEAALTSQLASAKEAMNKASGSEKSSLLSLMGSMAGAGLTAGFALKGAGGAKSTTSAAEATTVTDKIAAEKSQMTGKGKLASGFNSTAAADPTQAFFAHTKAEASATMADKDSVKLTSDRKSKVAASSASSNATTPPAAVTNSGQAEKASENTGGSATYMQSASQIGAVATSLATATDQNLGGQNEVNNADIAAKQDDYEATAYKNVQEGNKTALDKSSKMVDDAISALKTHLDLQKSTSDNITR